MEDLAVFTALNHSGSFGMNFVKLKKIYVIYRLRVDPYEWLNCFLSICGTSFKFGAIAECMMKCFRTKSE